MHTALSFSKPVEFLLPGQPGSENSTAVRAIAFSDQSNFYYPVNRIAIILAMGRWYRLRNWFREKWPVLAVAAGLLLAAGFGFGIGYIAADQSNHAPIIIEQNGPIH